MITAAALFACWLSGAGQAAAAPAPRIEFSSAEWAFAEAIAIEPGLAAFYGGRNLDPVFSGAAGAARRIALLAAIERASIHGLPPARYRGPDLERVHQAGASGADAELAFAMTFARWVNDVTGGIVQPDRVDSGIHRDVRRPPLDEVLATFAGSNDPAEALRLIEPRDPRYRALQAALAELQDELPAPGTPPVPAGLWRPGDRGPAIVALRGRLAALGLSAGDGEIFDEPLSAAVRQFQDRAGLQPDGIAGPQTIAQLNHGDETRRKALLIALERMRWMGSHDLSARHVWVNLPEFTARVVEHGQTIFETRVVIGKTDPNLRTPEFSDQMEYLVVNPAWNVPRSITIAEYLPRLQQNRHSVGHLDVVDQRGRVIPRDQIDFAKYTPRSFPYRMRQKPGDDNALGEVKFIFPNPWNIYLHDTPTKGLFSERRRTFSHGCVRVGRPQELAYELLRGQVADPTATYATALRSGRERWLPLEPTIPVHLVYFTSFPDDDGSIRSYPDIYGRDARLWEALQEAGLETGDGGG
ncbi:L,D-transpeptidase family protein [uncultured Paracoccus sp.]|uniref:L,D-transpeptidase family protein n=1 Tax=uncultured Paracoccus sp. TaxID=189685 RepID=UPI00260CBA7E|nr:L,D-transpeptidase family protein [uncultured Paracoccus sp.]